jgi:hypothetical protein
MKVLRAIGETVTAKDFNWCDPDEVVNVDGFVCCSASSCGCDRSFVGVLTRKGTTLAVVAEIDSNEMYERCKKVCRVPELFDELSERLAMFSVGDILRVQFATDDYQLSLADS